MNDQIKTEQPNEEPISPSELNGGLELKPTHTCSFCGLKNNSNHVQHMIVTDNAVICDICVEVCRDILGKKRREI